MVEKNVSQEYEKNEEAIMALLENGTFEYDQNRCRTIMIAFFIILW